MRKRIALASLLAASLLVALPSVAHAQDPLPPSQPPAVAPIVHTSNGYTCQLAERGELPEGEARTAVDVVCDELAKQKAGAGNYTVALGRLGSRTRLSVGNGTQSREAWMSSIDELPTASARTAEALATGRTVGETQNVDTVLASEAGGRRTKTGQLGAGASLIGATSVGTSSSVSTGFGLSLHYDLSRYAVVAEGRAVGIGSSNEKLVEISAGIGGQIFLSDGDLSPFAGCGLQIASYELTNRDVSGAGGGAYAELGLAGLRSAKVGVFGSVRAAMPFFTVAPSTYVVPVTMNLGLRFL